MNRTVAKRGALILALLLISMVAAACGGGGGSTTTSTTGNTPEAGAKAFFDAAFGGNADAAKAAICSAGQATADQMVSAFAAAAAAGTADTSGLTYAKASESGDDAVVNLGGTLKVTVAGTTTDVPYEGSGVAVPMKREGGVWKVCTG